MSSRSHDVRAQAISSYTHILGWLLNDSWKEIVSVLPPDMAMCANLRCPTICICENMSEWGTWRGGTVCRMDLNAKLLTDFSWPILMEVMRHEVAHQVTEALYGPEPAHGERFREICRLIGANPRASVLDPSTWTRQEGQEAQGERDRILGRIRKLLALSNSSDMHEAEAALCKAREIAAKFAIDLDEAQTDGDEEFAILCLGRPLLRKDRVMQMIAYLLNTYFEVRIIWHYSPSLFGARMGSVMTVYGTPARLRIAQYVYDCLLTFLETSWKGFAEKRKASGRAGQRNDQRDFKLGILEGFIETLRENAPDVPRSKALMESRHRLEHFVDMRNPSVRRYRGGCFRVNRDIHEEGMEIGRAFSIRPGLDGEDGGPRLISSRN